MELNKIFGNVDIGDISSVETVLNLIKNNEVCYVFLFSQNVHHIEILNLQMISLRK